MEKTVVRISPFMAAAPCWRLRQFYFQECRKRGNFFLPLFFPFPCFRGIKISREVSICRVFIGMDGPFAVLFWRNLLS
ncbi:hypothetical protein HMPREF1326_01041 [Akkermansia sp. KLE1605]|nr:hypothetical protein HMPREF1326_01041 [Akkermansia sp. KLE1605]